MKDELIVVTGGGGFIGGALIAEFRRQGHSKLRSVDIKPMEEWYQVFDDVENLVLDLNKMELPAEASPTAGKGGGAVPACMKDYARDRNVIARVDPVFTERTFNPVPVRIIIDKAGKVKHIHFLSAFPEQAKAISNALKQWKFKPHLENRKPVEVETGIMFGRASGPTAASGGNAATD